MVLVNYATKEIVAKIVYYGPGLCGKTTNLQYIHNRISPKKRGKMVSLATEADRTLFFDFLPVELGIVQGFRVRFQLYTVPGQVFYSATRKLVLKGADAIVFVADSQADVLGKNLESIEDMKQNLLENNLDPQAIPMVFQYNKRDLINIVDVRLLEKNLNYRQAPGFEAVAVDGVGVVETFKGITSLLIKDLKEKHTLMGGDTLRDLPPDIFEQKPEKPAAEEIPIESVLEMGSGIREEGAEEDVVPGQMLDKIESISLADTVQAEVFFDNVRKGEATEEARQKAEQVRRAMDEGYPGIGLDTEVVEPETAPVPEARSAPAAEPAPASRHVPEAAAAESWPAPEPAAAHEHDEEDHPRWATEFTNIASTLERLERDISTKREEERGGKAEAFDQAAVLARIDALEKGIKDLMEGHDRLILSLLEAVRDSRKANADMHEKLEDGINYIIGKLKEGPAAGRKRWF